jgi:hypothetical protein
MKRNALADITASRLLIMSRERNRKMATEKRLIEIIECLEHCADNTDCERCSRWLYHCDDHCVDDLLATAAKELRKFVDAVVLPCKIGDKVYRIDKGNYHSNWKPFVQELTVTEISWQNGRRFLFLRRKEGS